MSTLTGFEEYNLSELERKAYQDQNFLAQEILRRLEEALHAELAHEVHTKYAGDAT